MAKHTKTWKIGEYCQGGVITVTVTGKEILVQGKEWDTSTGYRKSSNQSNAKEFTRKTFNVDAGNVQRELADFLCDLTTSYWADQIEKWIKSKVKFGYNESIFW